LKSNCSS